MNIPRTTHYALVDLATIHREKRKKALTPVTILNDICEVLNKDIMIVCSPSRKTEHVRCRFILSYICDRLNVAPLTKVGQLINRDRTSVMNGRDTVKDYLDSNDSQFMPHWQRYLNNSEIFTPEDFGAEIKPVNKREEQVVLNGRLKGTSNQEELVERILNAKV